MAQNAGPKRIIVACGSGVASSMTSAERIKDLLRKWGVRNIRVEVVDFRSALRESKNADMFVNISPRKGGLAGTQYACPEVSGIPFMTGFGMEPALKEMLAKMDIEVEG